VKFEAVVFDLYQTLVRYGSEDADRSYRRMAAGLGVPAGRFIELWRSGRANRDTGSLRDEAACVVARLGLAESEVDTLVRLRREETRALLEPRGEVLAVLDELRRRGYRLGLISVCSDEVADVWDETTLHSKFDTVALSCVLGVTKPDPAIYLHACADLRVEPARCLYVGDGANDELRGAQRVGMTAVQILVPDGEAHWGGRTIESLEQVLELV
jgi:putative hydrolase of the HAD superfamily